MAAIMRGTNPHIVQQMVDQVFHLGHLVDDPEVSNLAMVIPRPAGDILFHMMKEWVQISQSSGESCLITLMLIGMRGLCGPKDLIGFAIGFRKSGVVLIVEVQVQTELIRQRLQPG